MSYQCFDLSIQDQVAHLVLNRPEKRNSMIPAFWRELPEAIRDIDDNVRARAVVISSTGPHFTSGLDVSVFGGLAEKHGEKDPMARRQAGLRFYQNVRQMQETFSSLERCRVPVLAAIQGGCIGGGVDLVTACDMRYATRDAFLTIHEINVGMTADVGTFPRIFKLLPEGVARELAYTGRRMPAEEAQQLGLVNRVYADHDAMLQGVMEIARDIASKPPLAVHGCKRMANYARDHSTADGLDYIGIWNASMLQPEEIMEAMQANAEGRPGRFAELPAAGKVLGED
ncbi:MAG: crotonase/enoyl-CoA hydratase family protein [Ectothiorhodospiraceae bacterium]|nr:crotonase/enoyl-CoA hydratase family protein [Ectothiorhodospiraceae bacterium]MCH8502807.1 crotonase/enoyl-CoA hydratase family protein [Ectothiorhodospiraceae bacterium]